MVQTDVGDDGEQGGDDVGAVEASPEAHLNDGYVHPLLFEVLESQSCGQFEERGVQGLEERALLLHEVDDALLGNHLSVDPDSFAEVHQMRTRVQADPVARRLQDGGQRVADAALAVGAAHVDGMVRLVRMAEVLVQPVGVLQSLLIRSGPDVLEQGGYVEEVIDGFLIIHFYLLIFIF